MALQRYPQPNADCIDAELEADFELVMGTIRTLRNLRSEVEIKPGAKIAAILQSESDRERQILANGRSYIETLAKIEPLTLTAALDSELTQTIAGVVGTVQVLIPLAGVIDVPAVRGKIEKRLAKVEADIKTLSGRLNNPNFADKAPADIVQGAKTSLAEAQKQAEILRDRLERLR